MSRFSSTWQARIAPPWAWLLVLAFLAKAAVLLVATAAAKQQGVALAEICSVYGVRTVAVDWGAQDSDKTPAAGQHNPDGAQCVLSSLLGSEPPPVVAAPMPREVKQPLLSRRAIGPTPQGIDASRRWLAAQLHAPPAAL
jgi:hypothetical protein